MGILVTGANGFVGAALVARLRSERNVRVRGSVRTPGSAAGDNVVVGDLSPTTDWSLACAGMQVVVHTAARVHQMGHADAARNDRFRAVNVEGTLALARQAAAAGVRRFVFVSSVKVLGERTLPGRPYRAGDTTGPRDPYGVSKLEAENRLDELSQTTGLEIVVVRPPLVYGPGVKANFERMMRLVEKQTALPLAAIDNRRSLIGLANLVDVLVRCARHEAAAGRKFLVSDDDDLSTPDLFRRLANALGRRARLFPVPVALLRAGARMVGRAEYATRLCDSLQVDISETKRILGWVPMVTVNEGLLAVAEHHASRRSR